MSIASDDENTILSEDLDQLSLISTGGVSSPYSPPAKLKIGTEYDMRMLVLPRFMATKDNSVKDPVYCQREDARDIIAKIQDGLREYCSQSPRLPEADAKPGNACVVFYEKKFYRGTIRRAEKLGKGNLSLSVLFVDNGDSSTFTLKKDVFASDDNLRSIPPQAYTVYLDEGFDKRFVSKLIQVEITGVTHSHKVQAQYNAKFIKDLGDNVIEEIAGNKIEPFRLPQFYRIDYTPHARFEVIITDAAAAAAISYRQWANNESYKLLQDFLLLNADKFDKLQKEDARKDTVCLAKMLNRATDQKEVHRVRIKTDPNGVNIVVVLIDLGKIVPILTTQLMEIPEKILKYPAFVTTVALGDRYYDHLPAITAAFNNSEPIFIRILKPSQSQRNTIPSIRVSRKCDSALPSASPALSAVLPRSKRSGARTPTRTPIPTIPNISYAAKSSPLASKQAIRASAPMSAPSPSPGSAQQTIASLTVLHMPTGKRLDGTISYANSHDDFYIQPQRNHDLLLKLPDAVADTYRDGGRNAPLLTVYDPKQLCCAKWNVDQPGGDGLFYRAEMIGRSGPGKYHVRFIDYGNIAEVAKNDLKQLHPKFSKERSLCYHARVHPSQEALFAKYYSTGEMFQFEVHAREPESDYYRIKLIG